MDEAKKNDRLSGVNLCRIMHRADGVSGHANVAYWMENHGDAGTFAYHCRELVDDLKELADLCGFDLVGRAAPDDLEDAAVDILLGDTAAHRSLEMNAELPDETLAVLKIKGMVS